MKNELQGDEETTRSGLFFDAMRIIREMREANPGKPRYALWENVCFGAGTLVTTDEGFKPIEDIAAGDVVKTHLGNYMPVVETYRHEDKECIEVRFHGAEPIIATPNHPFLTRRLVDGKLGSECWKPAGKLNRHDFIGYRTDGFGEQKIGLFRAYTLGKCIVAGTAEEISEICEDNKIISFIFSLIKNEQKAVLRGILDNAGHCMNNRWRVSASSREIMYGIVRLVRNIYHIQPRIEKSQDNWTILFDTAKFDRYADGYVWSRVAKTVPAEKQTVYNLSVADDNTYEVNGVSVHNCGAFSSNGGKDFRVVLEEFCHIVDPEFEVPMPTDGWKNAGRIDGENFQLCWRVFDAQYWGVPQRRKRIYMLLDADGHTANDIMFFGDDSSLQINWDDPEHECPKYVSPPEIKPELKPVFIIGSLGKEYRAVDGYNGEVDNVQPTLGQNCGMSTGRNGVLEEDPIILNDQGGERMDVTKGKVSTLRAESHHPPIVLQNVAGFLPGQGKAAHGIGFEEETAPTLRTGAVAGVVGEVIPLEHNPSDSRIKVLSEDAAVQTLTARMGTGGNNVPMIMAPIDVDRIIGTLEAIDGPGGFHSQAAEEGKYVVEVPIRIEMISCLEGNGTRPSHKGPGYNEGEVSYTLNTIERPVVVYGIGSYGSNGMLSDNPEAGIYEADKAKTIDCNGGNPACHQGGMAVLEPGFSLSKNSHMMNLTEGLADTLVASQYKEPTGVIVPKDDFDEADERETFDVRFTSEGSKNARGHVYETEKTRCLDTGGADPDSNHGGICILDEKDVCAFSQNQREEIRELGDAAGALSAQPGSHQQTYIAEEEIQQFIEENNADAKHQQDLLQGENDVCRTLAAGTHGSASHLTKTITKVDKNYHVRRLTPQECAKLQGFPTWWCTELQTEEPTEEDIAFWRDVFLQWDEITKESAKPKSDAQIKKWLKNPYSDAAEFKLWGNGIALPNALYVMRGVAKVLKSPE